MTAKMCEWCGKNPVKFKKFCCNPCRMAWLHKHNEDNPHQRHGPKPKPLREKHLNVTVNLTPEQAVAAAKAGGMPDGKIPHRYRKNVRQGIKKLLELAQAS